MICISSGSPFRLAVDWNQSRRGLAGRATILSRHWMVSSACVRAYMTCTYSCAHYCSCLDVLAGLRESVAMLSVYLGAESTGCRSPSVNLPSVLPRPAREEMSSAHDEYADQQDDDDDDDAAIEAAAAKDAFGLASLTASTSTGKGKASSREQDDTSRRIAGLPARTSSAAAVTNPDVLTEVCVFSADRVSSGRA